MKHSFRTLLAGIAFCAGIASAAPSASALTADEIIMMSKQGLPEEMLITIIKNATDLPPRDQATRAQLENAGINARVISAIFDTPAASPLPDVPVTDEKKRIPSGPRDPLADTGLFDDRPAQTDKTTTDKPSDATSIAPIKPRETPAPSSGRPTDKMPDFFSDQTPENHTPETPNAPQPAQPHGTQAAADAPAPPGFAPLQAIGDSTILAPVESSNVPLVFRKYFEEAYETYNVEAEVARRYAMLQSDTASERAYDAEVPRVIGYRNAIPENPVGSLESCLSLADKMKPSMDTPLGAALNQCIGLALEKLDAPAMAAAYLDRALQSKAKLSEFSATLETFLRTAHISDYTSTDPLRIKDHAGEVSDSVRQAFLYFIGYSLVYGPQPDTTLAKQILANVTGTSIYRARARILLATLAVRAPEFKFKTAAEYLNEALRTLETLESDEAYELRNTAWLALARIAFENHAYDMADTFYRNVDVNSHHLRNAMLENAWGMVFAQKFPQALALSHALRAPNFSLAWLPDLQLLEASAFLGLCRYDQAEHALDALKHDVLSQGNALRTYMARVPQKDYYNQVLKHADAPESSLMPDLAYRRVLSDSVFRALHRSLRFLSDERQALSRHVGPGFLSWPKLQAVYDEMILQRQQYMSVVLSNIFDSALSEIHALDISASQIAIEIRLARRQREAECLKIVAAGGQCKQAQSHQDGATFSKRANDAYWTFDGEFWRDELWSMQSGITSVCE